MNGRILDDGPALGLQGGLNAIGVRDDGFERWLQVQQYELGVEFETKGVAERGLKRETTQLVGCAAQAPQFDRWRFAMATISSGAPGRVTGGSSLAHRVDLRVRGH